MRSFTQTVIGESNEKVEMGLPVTASENGRIRGMNGDVKMQELSMGFECAAILLIGFNRPERLAAQVERLRQVRPSRLFIAVDGPRKDRPEDVDAVRRSRDAAKLVDWPCELSIRFLDENHGCRFAPPEAISWMFESVDAGIILEDDCVPTIEFLLYASELLDRYRDESRVGMISGNNFYGFQTDKTASYHFSRHVHIWGWATWRRAWQFYDGSMGRYQNTLRELLDSPAPNKYERYRNKYLQSVIQNPTTWDLQWFVALTANELLSVVPRINLVSNVGHEKGALHTGGFVFDLPHFCANEGFDDSLSHPKSVLCDEAADARHANRFAGYVPRILTIVGAWPGMMPLMRLLWKIEKSVPVLFRV